MRTAPQQGKHLIFSMVKKSLLCLLLVGDQEIEQGIQKMTYYDGSGIKIRMIS